MSKKTFKTELLALNDDGYIYDRELDDTIYDGHKFIKVSKKSNNGINVSDQTLVMDTSIKEELRQFKIEQEREQINFKVFQDLKNYADVLSLPLLEKCSYYEFLSIL